MGVTTELPYLEMTLFNPLSWLGRMELLSVAGPVFESGQWRPALFAFVIPHVLLQKGDSSMRCF
jgi:hypothetical protein